MSKNTELQQRRVDAVAPPAVAVRTGTPPPLDVTGRGWAGPAGAAVQSPTLPWSAGPMTCGPSRSGLTGRFTSWTTGRFPSRVSTATAAESAGVAPLAVTRNFT